MYRNPLFLCPLPSGISAAFGSFPSSVGFVLKHEVGLELGLGRLQRGHQQIADVAGGLVEVEAHPVAAQSLGDDVEVYAEARHEISQSIPISSKHDRTLEAKKKGRVGLYLFSLIM